MKYIWLFLISQPIVFTDLYYNQFKNKLIINLNGLSLKLKHFK